MVSFIVEGSGDGRHVHKSLGDVSSIFVDTLDNSGESQWFVGDDNEDIIWERIVTELDHEVDSLNKLIPDWFKLFGLEEGIPADYMVVDLKIGAVVEVGKRQESSSIGPDGQVDDVVWLLVAIEDEGGALYFDNNDDLTVKYKFIVFVLYSWGIDEGVIVDGIGGVELEVGEHAEDVVDDCIFVDGIVEGSESGKRVVRWGRIVYFLNVFDINIALRRNIIESIVVAAELLYLIEKISIELRCVVG